MKPVNVNSNTYINFGAKNNEKNPKFEVKDQVKISKCKTFLQKITLQMSLEKVCNHES